jgi:hypothetical protein
MPRAPFDASVIRSAGDDPATGSRAVAFRTHRLDRYLDGPPAAGMTLEDAESAGASFAVPRRTADACRHLLNLARATHQQAAPL